MFLCVHVSHYVLLAISDVALSPLQAEGLRTVIEPVPELVEAMLYQVFGCAEIEPRINCIDQLAHVTPHSPS